MAGSLIALAMLAAPGVEQGDFQGRASNEAHGLPALEAARQSVEQGDFQGRASSTVLKGVSAVHPRLRPARSP
jgi:hypothetical protein